MSKRRIERRSSMPFGKNEAVSLGRIRMLSVVIEDVGEEQRGHDVRT